MYFRHINTAIKINNQDVRDLENDVRDMENDVRDMENDVRNAEFDIRDEDSEDMWRRDPYLYYGGYGY